MNTPANAWRCRSSANSTPRTCSTPCDSVASLVTAGAVPASQPLAPATNIPFAAARPAFVGLSVDDPWKSQTWDASRLQSTPPPQRLYAAARPSHLAPQTPQCYVRCGYRRFLASGFALPWLVWFSQRLGVYPKRRGGGTFLGIGRHKPDQPDEYSPHPTSFSVDEESSAEW